MGQQLTMKQDHGAIPGAVFGVGEPVALVDEELHRRRDRLHGRDVSGRARPGAWKATNLPDSGVAEEERNFGEDPFDWPEDPRPYPRRRAARLLTRVIATLLIISLVLAFPLEYLLNEQLRSHHVEAVLAVTEAVVVAVLLAVSWAVRRTPR
ncbi:MAG: hypothetical protein NVSMB17_07140 [Candidatus Dormibacteria bacterium]